MRNRVMITFGFMLNLALLVVLILIWSWCANPTVYGSHPLQKYFLPLFVVLVYLWMLWILCLIFTLVKRFFLSKNQFIFSYICFLISIILLIYWTVDLTNHFIKPAFFVGWIPYFNVAVSKQLLFFWIPAHLNFLLLYFWIVLSKKVVDYFIDSVKIKRSPYWFIGWIIQFLSGCVWAFMLSFKEKYGSWALLFGKKTFGWEMWGILLNWKDWVKAFFGAPIFSGIPMKYVFQSWINQTENWPIHLPMLYFTKIILLFITTSVVLVLLQLSDKQAEQLPETTTGSSASASTTTT